MMEKFSKFEKTIRHEAKSNGQNLSNKLAIGLKDLSLLGWSYALLLSFSEDCSQNPLYDVDLFTVFPFPFLSKP